MPEVPVTKAAVDAQASAWADLIADDAVEAAPVVVPDGARITTTVDLPECPRCGSPAKHLGRADRACMACGLTWTVSSEREELDAKADREVRSRGFNEERGRARRVPKGASRW